MSNDFKFGEHILYKALDNVWYDARYLCKEGSKHKIWDEKQQTYFIYSNVKHDPDYFRNGEEVEVSFEGDPYKKARYVSFDEYDNEYPHVVEQGSILAAYPLGSVRRPNSIEQKLQSFKDRWDKKFLEMNKQLDELEQEIKGKR